MVSRDMAAQLSLRPYQRQAVDATLAHFRASDEAACIVLPTGAGKSVIIAELCRLARGRVLVLAHVKELCEQNHDKHAKLAGTAGLYAAGLGRKEHDARIVFGSVQSVAQNLKDFTEEHSLLIIDECHRLGNKDSSQYAKVIGALTKSNPRLRVLGLTATPFRLDLGWVYERHARGFVRSEEPKPFKRCVFEVSLRHLIEQGYLTRPTVVDAPIAQYDFSALRPDRSGHFRERDVNRLLVKRPRVTHAIVEQILELSAERYGVMIFAATVDHAKEIAGYLPAAQTGLILGETSTPERDRQVTSFREQNLKYLVNVAVLTTGFDAPHVDLIAILRPTESVSLYQQIAGRGLRLSPGKTDCLLIDYAGNGISLFHPEVGETRPNPLNTPVPVTCPKCAFVNTFWGTVDAHGLVTEHHGRRCKAVLTTDDGKQTQCDYRFRFKECNGCGAENDIAARRCHACEKTLVDPDEQLKRALKLKDARVLRVMGQTLETQAALLVITYHDEDGATLNERFDLSQSGQRAAFNRIFLRRTQGAHGTPRFGSAQQACEQAATIQSPDFVVGRKHNRFFRVEERFFDYQGRYRKAEQL